MILPKATFDLTAFLGEFDLSAVNLELRLERNEGLVANEFAVCPVLVA